MISLNWSEEQLVDIKNEDGRISQIERFLTLKYGF